MARTELEYPKQPYGTVNRYSPRASYALRTIHGIINSCPILHVSFNPPDSSFPTILPMIGQMGSFDRPSADEGQVLDLYLHGYVSSRIINTTRKTTGAADEPDGLPVCVAASHLDGLVLALTPNSHSYNYRSAVLFGHATLVEDTAEKLYAMELMTDAVVPGRWSNSRVPPNAAEMSSTGVLRVRITTGSAKIRAGPPSDDRHDLENPDVVGRVWTGVVPVHTTFGSPIPGPYNAVTDVPPYLQDTIDEWNQSGAESAMEAANPRKAAPKS
ncbi:hypothetical protein SODALDRAFT_329097 [Sodiomyces alkalinus F11]|uniref:Flavin-nucleotide-binding protein n=1 Tax=Sodiomyces alkalinus (strain CBS 110278 / VKM F-3762 / F11) TaxID=1314773 RepID=A0A3N2PK49_SODAK|nr:hypothetical protein SODALDRAFT_329097 [Sodiomyces alkalinus F11]ROT34895.1 hypothetical protein SODALDRAFT_329097 [Sodiomyces alkalinus F11]